MTLFTIGVPYALTIRIYDAFFTEGPKILYRVALYILKSIESKLLNADDNMLLDAIKKHWLALDPDETMTGASKIPIKRQTIVDYISEYESEPEDEILEFVNP